MRIEKRHNPIVGQCPGEGVRADAIFVLAVAEDRICAVTGLERARHLQKRRDPLLRVHQVARDRHEVHRPDVFYQRAHDLFTPAHLRHMQVGNLEDRVALKRCRQAGQAQCQTHGFNCIRLNTQGVAQQRQRACSHGCACRTRPAH